MHPFFIAGALLHATALAVASFFVFFAASKSSGWLKTFGNVLGGWLLIVAVAGIGFAAIAPTSMRSGYHHGWMMDQSVYERRLEPQGRQGQ